MLAVMKNVKENVVEDKWDEQQEVVARDEKDNVVREKDGGNMIKIVEREKDCNLNIEENKLNLI